MVAGIVESFMYALEVEEENTDAGTRRRGTSMSGQCHRQFADIGFDWLNRQNAMKYETQ